MKSRYGKHRTRAAERNFLGQDIGLAKLMEDQKQDRMRVVASAVAPAASAGVSKAASAGVSKAASAGVSKAAGVAKAASGVQAVPSKPKGAKGGGLGAKGRGRGGKPSAAAPAKPP